MIGGDTELIIQVLKDNLEYDENGKKVPVYGDEISLFGWIDFTSGDSRYDYKAKIEDSTHVFICDYINIGKIDIEKARAVCKGRIYDVKYIDDPMELHEQLEIYLKLVGGQIDAEQNQV